MILSVFFFFLLAIVRLWQIMNQVFNIKNWFYYPKLCSSQSDSVHALLVVVISGKSSPNMHWTHLLTFKIRHKNEHIRQTFFTSWRVWQLMYETEHNNQTEERREKLEKKERSSERFSSREGGGGGGRGGSVVLRSVLFVRLCCQSLSCSSRRGEDLRGRPLSHCLSLSTDSSPTHTYEDNCTPNMHCLKLSSLLQSSYLLF